MARKWKRFLAVLVAFVACLGIAESVINRELQKRRATSTAREVGLEKLQSDLNALALSPVGQQHDIPKAAWPFSVQPFTPLAVQRHGEDILIV